MIEPHRVNLSAFLIKLIKIYWKRLSSPISFGITGYYLSWFYSAKIVGTGLRSSISFSSEGCCS